MTSPDTTGSDRLAATWGGPGLRWRHDSHAEELAAGEVWRRCGVCSEVAPLREVLLHWPGEELAFDDDPNRHLMLGHIDLETIRRQTEAIATFYEMHGVVVHLHRPSRPPPPNMLFMRDLFFMTPLGAIIARPASAQRAGETRFATAALAGLGIPILYTVRGRGWFEGADALWLNGRTVVVGVGHRTNDEGAESVAHVLAESGVETLKVPLAPPGQHLLGNVVLVDNDLAIVDRQRASDELLAVLRDYGFRLVLLSPGEELRERRGMNFVTLAPGKIVMPAGCPEIRRRLEEEGVEVHALDVSQYLVGGGGLACLTGIVARNSRSAMGDSK